MGIVGGLSWTLWGEIVHVSHGQGRIFVCSDIIESWRGYFRGGNFGYFERNLFMCYVVGN